MTTKLSTMENSRLFTPLKIGKITLRHRVVMAPMTRLRNNSKYVPFPAKKQHYSQRASEPGTLIITEATVISPRGLGDFCVPGIWSEEQIQAWKGVVDEVHKQGSYIYLQLWATGRAASAKLMEQEHLDIVSSSGVPLNGENYATPRELNVGEIRTFEDDFAQAARNAIDKAGFDGVEIHAANGYLIDQFTQDTCNRRADEYGGSIENRSRFALEVTQAVVDAVGADKVGIRLSPWSDFQDMKMDDPVPQFLHLIGELKKLNLAYLHLVESRVSGGSDVKGTESLHPFVAKWGTSNPVLLAGGFKGDDETKRHIDKEYADSEVAIAFGRYFTSNPDLPFRIKNNIELEPYDRTKFYTQSLDGYTDYPFSDEFAAARL